MVRLVLAFIFLAMLCAGMPAVAAGSAAQATGLTLQALEKEDQDAIADQLGQRAGVVVAAVAANSPAAKAGFVQGEVILKIGDRMVDSPAAAEAALTGKSGALEVVGFILDEQEGVKVVKRTLTLTAAAQTETKTSQPDAETQKKLKALDDAHKAGVLSDEEYAKKRAELLAKSAPKPDPEAEKKLKALDDAHKAGIISDEEYAAKRAALQKGQAATGAAPASKYLSTTKGSTYQHAVGFSFWYPDGWTVKDVGEGLQLVPANTAVQNDQPAEMYLITGQPLEGTGITTVTDPRIPAVLDQFVQQQISPAMQRKNAPAALTLTNGDGLVFDWEAPGQNGGTVVTRVYACVLKGWGVMFCAIGAKEPVFNRQLELKTIFNSFGFEAGKQDPAIVGTWFLTATRAVRNEDNVNFTSDDPRRASSVSDEQITVQLNADGSVTRTSIYRMIAGGGAAGGGGKVWIDTGDQKTVTQGR